MKKFFVGTIFVLSSIFVFGQRISILDKDNSNSFLFDNSNPLCLVGIIQRSTSGNTNPIKPELAFELSKKQMLKDFSCVYGAKSFGSIVNSLGEDSTVLDSLGYEWTVTVEEQDLTYYDFKNITRLVIYEKEVYDSIKHEKSYVIDKIAIAKKIKGFSDKYIITGSISYNALLLWQSYKFELPIENNLNRDWINLENPTSLLSTLKSMQLAKKNAREEVSIFHWWDTIKRESKWIVDNCEFNIEIKNVALQSAETFADMLDANGNPIMVNRTDTTIYWINSSNPIIAIGYYIEYDTNKIDIDHLKITYPPGHSVYFSYSDLQEYSHRSFPEVEDYLKIKNANEIPSILFLHKYLTQEKKYIYKNRKGIDKIKKDFYLNPYFPKSDPDFIDFLKD